MYQALYRKWRPRVFEDVAGQPYITRALRNEIVTGTVAHAYLFTGSRGTGKTTCAKILAKAVNCLSPRDGNPCGECEICRGIDSGSVTDVVEIDAASNNGVDNIRELREETVFSPAISRYRVYIIDEVHMLSGGAFNALLKTLEEPPDYVIFILATTEVHRLPATIVSRCQRFDFRRIPSEEIAKRLLFVASQEGIDLSDGAAGLIARLSDGALRDALSLLERCAGVGGKVDEQAVTKAAGLAGREYLFNLTGAVIAGDFPLSIRILEDICSQSKDITLLCEELISHFRDVLLLRGGCGPQSLLKRPSEELGLLSSQADSVSPEAVLNYLDTLGQALESLRRSGSPRVEMEMCLLRMCNPELSSSVSALLRRVNALEAALAVTGTPAVAASPPASVPKEPAPVKRPPETPPSKKEAPPAEAATASQPSAEGGNAAPDEPLPCWDDVIGMLVQSDPALGGVLKGSRGILHGEHVLVDSQNRMFSDLIRKSEHQKSLVEAIRRAAGHPYKVGVYKRSLKQPAQEDRMEELFNNARQSGIDIKER